MNLYKVVFSARQGNEGRAVRRVVIVAAKSIDAVLPELIAAGYENIALGIRENLTQGGALVTPELGQI